jgi:hypothetical protein
MFIALLSLLKPAEQKASSPAVLGDAPQLTAERATTNRIYQSDEITNEAWAKHLITEFIGEDGPPELKDRLGKFVSTANLAALHVSADGAREVAEAWMQGFSLGTQALAQAMGDAPTSGVWVKMCYPLEPSATRRSVDIFVVSNNYDSVRNRDELYVYVSRDLPMKPTVQIPYISESGFTTNLVRGYTTVSDVPHSHWTNTVTVSRFGQVYQNCHRMWFTRPASLKDCPVFLHRHGVFGSRATGFEWGSVAVTVTLPGEPPTLTYTGAITNLAEGVVSKWSNGGFVGLVELEQQTGEQQ